MSNLGSLPQIPAGTTIDIASNASWLDAFYVQQPGYPSTPTTVLGTLNATTSVVVNSLANISVGCLVVGYGILPGTQVASVNPGTMTMVLNQAAIIDSGAIVPLSIFGPPLDLSGISFQSQVREALTSATILLIASTTNGRMVNGGITGTFGWNVAPAQLPSWPTGLVAVGSFSGVVDIQAADNSGQIIDLTVESGPIPLTVTPGPLLQPSGQLGLMVKVGVP